MTIRRIKVVFAGPDGVPRGVAQGSTDRRAELVRMAREELEAYRSTARAAGDANADADFKLFIEDAPPAPAWKPAAPR